MFFLLSYHQVDWAKKELLKLAAQEKMIKEQEAAHRKREAEHQKQETVHRKQEAALQKQIERLNHEVSKLKADLADKHKERQGAKALGDAYQRLHDEKVGIEHQLNTAMEAHKISTQHIRELVQENQHLKASNEDAKRRVVGTTGEIQVCSWNVQPLYQGITDWEPLAIRICTGYSYRHPVCMYHLLCTNSNRISHTSC